MSLQEIALLPLLENTELSDGLLICQMGVTGAGHAVSYMFSPIPFLPGTLLTLHSNPD